MAEPRVKSLGENLRPQWDETDVVRIDSGGRRPELLQLGGGKKMMQGGPCGEKGKKHLPCDWGRTKRIKKSGEHAVASKEKTMAPLGGGSELWKNSYSNPLHKGGQSLVRRSFPWRRKEEKVGRKWTVVDLFLTIRRIVVGKGE